MPNNKLYCLGRPFLELGGKTVKLEMRKSLALLIYLRTAEHDYSRESLAALFWPEYDQQHALANLRRVLASLKQSLQGECLEADREKIGLIDHSMIWLDVERFHGLLAIAKNHIHVNDQVCLDCLHSLEEAIQLYRGDFLEGFNLGDCPVFDEWQTLQRESIRQELAFGLETLANGYSTRSQWKLAITHALRWVALDSLNEPAQRMLIDLYNRSGQRNIALLQYEEFTRELNDQLGQSPEPETTQLVQQNLPTEIAPSLGISKQSSYAVTAPLLKTKLYIPSARSKHVVRNRLLTLMEESAAHEFTLVSAPAGYGKTSLLTEWATYTNLPIAWVSLDAADNDSNRFFTYVCEAINGVHSGAGDHALEMLGSSMPIPLPTVLSVLLNDLCEVTEPFVLILDDYHIITAQSVHNAVAFFLDHLIPEMHLVIVTRTDPPLPLARLRSRQQLAEIRASDLRFYPDESAEFLNHIMGLNLNESDLLSLESRTEGWIVGLQMAALSLKGQTNKAAFIKSFRGSHRYILDYLVEEVLNWQPPEIRDFLLQTSILDRMCWQLCDRVIEAGSMAADIGPVLNPSSSKRSSRDMLDYLDRCNLFLIPLDDDMKWYRYHNLFADLLQVRLQQLGPALEGGLHKRAAGWLAENFYPVEAVKHALASKDHSLAADLIEKFSLGLIARSEIATVMAWINSLPPEVFHSRPRLIIYHGWLLTRLGEVVDLDSIAKEAESLLVSSPPSADVDECRNYITQQRAYMANLREDAELAIQVSSRHINTPPGVGEAGKHLIEFQLGYAYYSRGDLTNAENIFNTVEKSALSSDDIYTVVATNIELAGIQLLRGNIYKTEQILTRIHEWLYQKVDNPVRLDSIIKVYQANIQYEKNELDEANQLVQAGIEGALLGSRANTLAYGYTTLAYICRAQGNLQQAQIAIDKALQQVEHYRTYPRTVKRAKTCQVYQWLAEGNLPAVIEWSKGICASIEDPLTFNLELEHIALAKVWLANSQWAKALELLRRLAEAAEAGGRFSRLIKILIMQSIAYQSIGDHVNSRAIMQRGIQLAEPQGYLRTFTDEGQPTMDILRGFEGDAHDIGHEYLHKLLDSFSDFTASGVLPTAARP